MTSAELLAAARDVLERRTGATRGLWPRAAAVLARQAIEQRAVELEPGLAGVSGRATLLSLPAVVGDEQLVEDVAHAWGALSGATHHHAYDLPPTALELEWWFGVVERFVHAGPTAAGTSP